MEKHFYRFLCFLLGVCFVNVASADWPGVARLTQVAHDVRVTDAAGKTKRGSVSAMLAPGSTIQTGNGSRAEVSVGDQMLIRLAANTKFTVAMRSGDFDLKKGAVLVEASKRAKGAKISAGNAVAAIGGATAMIEHYSGVCKFLVLEGTGRLYRPAHLGDSVLVEPGQMVIGNPDSPVSDPVDFDIGRFIATSHFIVDLPALRSQPAIAAEIQKQQREKSDKTLIDTNLVIHGGGTLVSLVDPAQLTRAPTSKPSATQSHE